MKKILLILCMLFVSTAYASVLDDCVQKIAANDELWQQRLFDKKDGIFHCRMKNRLGHSAIRSSLSDGIPGALRVLSLCCIFLRIHVLYLKYPRYLIPFIIKSFPGFIQNYILRHLFNHPIILNRQSKDPH